MTNSTKRKVSRHPKREKPAKPTNGFPLFAHNNGQWAKKVRGDLHYFGTWEDPDAALAKWNAEKDDLLAGRTPRPKSDELTLKELADRFLTAKHHRVESGKLSPLTYRDYVEILQHVADVFGKHRPVVDLAADDFQALRKSFAATHGPHRIAKDGVCTRSLFKWAYESGLIEYPVRFGPDFKTPLRKAKLKASRADGRKDFAADEITRLLEAAPAPLKAMILLGVNCGLGQTDIAELQRSNIEGNWLTFPLPKTEVDRRAYLWPETIAAIAAMHRPEPKDAADADCVFLTRSGKRVMRLTAKQRTDPVGKDFARLMKELGLNGRRGLYGLWHTFETVAGEAKDQPAVDRVMGHSDSSMAATYGHRISDERLRDVPEMIVIEYFREVFGRSHKDRKPDSAWPGRTFIRQ